MVSRRLLNKVIRESKKSEKELKKYLNKLIEDEIKRMDIVDARGTIRVGDYVFEYVVVGRKVKRVRML